MELIGRSASAVQSNRRLSSLFALASDLGMVGASEGQAIEATKALLTK